MNPGDEVGPYTVVDRLGAGGMGEVYRARDTRLGREVALKQLSDRTSGSDVARRRVLREARAAAALSHPNIATIYDVLETPGGLVIVMEYVPGETLASRLRRGALPLDEALAYAVQIADALADAHAHGIIHRDLKPANIHLTPDGKAKILDFGIARSVDEAGDATATMTGGPQIVGTPAYMAPEQLAGGRGDQRTDVYGLGLVLFEMLSGQRPFQRAGVAAHALAVLDGHAPQVRSLAPHVPALVSDAVARALARDPDDRFATAREIGSTLRHAVRDLSEAKTGRFSQVAHRSNPTRWAIIAGAVLAVGTAVAWLLWAQPWTTSVSAHASAIGILPFRNQSGDAANDPLAVGLTDAVARRLSSVRALRVLPLDESREALRSRRPGEPVAKTLGATFVIEGTLQRSGNSLDVTLSLVGDDGRQHPAGTYTGDASRLFDLHRAVAEGLTAALTRAGALNVGASPEARPPTLDQDAFADYAQAKVFLERPDVPGSLNHAIDLLLSATRRDQQFALAYAALGEAYWAQFRETKDPTWTTKAQAANLEALRIDPAQPEVRMALAVMYQGLGDSAKASEELRQVLALQPRNDNAHLVLSAIHVDKGEWDAAVAEATAAIALRPNYWRNHAQLGDALLRAGRLDGAVNAYRRLTELQPDSARGYQRLGTALQAAGLIDEALANYEKAAAIRPTWAMHSNMGTIHYWRGEHVQAVADYQRAIELAPNEAEPYANLGDALQKLGQPDRAAENYRRAIVEIRKALAIKPNDPMAVSALALYQAKLGMRDAAASSSELAGTLSPQEPEVLFVRAIVQALAGRSASACEAVTAALAHGKGAEEVRRADELKSLRGCPAYDRLQANVK